MDSSSLRDDPLLSSVPVREGRKALGGVSLTALVGRGGMGAVYRGRHPRLGIDVAVKIMAPLGVLSPEKRERYAARFFREARTASRLDSPYVVRVLDVGTEGDVNYLVMELVEGETAAERLRRKGPLPEAEAGRICLAAAYGLGEAHRRGIVHRDVKPANILVSSEGRTKVADLGLARPFAGTDGSAEEFTASGAWLGTPSYVAPEQTRPSAEVGPPADVWSLGVTLWQLLTGRLPFEDADHAELTMAVRNRPAPDILGLRPDLTDRMREILERCLRKAPAERYADCTALAQELKGHIRDLGSGQSRPEGGGQPRRDGRGAVPG